MKVALLSPFIHPIVEPFAGGTEAFLYRLAIGLSRSGVEVVCYACEGSVIPGVEIRSCNVAKSALVYPRAAHEMNGEELLAIRAYEDAVMYQAIGDMLDDTSIDILHNHSFSSIPFFLAHFIRLPTLHTLHLPPMLPVMTEALRFCASKDIVLHLVGVSHVQAGLWQPYYRVSQVIYNGLDIKEISYSLKHTSTLAFVGRIDPDKGVEDAIEVATRLGKQLDIYGAPQPYNLSYFEACIQPLLASDSNIRYHGAVDQRTLFQGLRQAQALLMPVKWDEPFGNVIIEAMAVGTPVIMYDRGSARELIIEGVSGYIVPPDQIMAMVAAVERTATLDRAACADAVRERFSMEKCVASYLTCMQAIC